MMKRRNLIRFPWRVRFAEVDRMDIEFLGAHNTESKETRHVTLLIDGVLALDAGALTSTLSLAEQLKLKAVLITHPHYDHLRDIPALAMNAALNESRIHLYSTQEVREALEKYLLNGDMYPNFFERPADSPRIEFTLLSPNVPVAVENYSVTAVPVKHSIPAVSIQVASPEGKTLLYTGDTGPNLGDCWRIVSPQMLIIEVTMSNAWEKYALRSGHMTPAMLKGELLAFQEMKGYMPEVFTVHMIPAQEPEIAKEIAAVAAELGHEITLAREGMRVSL